MNLCLRLNSLSENELRFYLVFANHLKPACLCMIFAIGQHNLRQLRFYKPENNEICSKAIIFARVSSKKQEKGASIDAQKSTIYEYCARQNFTIIKEFIITESSSRGDCKQYHEMLKFVLGCSHINSSYILINRSRSTCLCLF